MNTQQANPTTVTALVLGATGLVGRAVVDALVASPQVRAVVAITRRPRPHPAAKVRNLVIDFEAPADYACDINGDLLFSCLGTTRRQAGSRAAQRRVDVDYQLQVAQAAAVNGVRHYLLCSSSGANPQSRNAYLKMKGELEVAVRELGFERLTLLRPSLLLGERDQLRPAEALGARVLPLLCRLPGLQRYRPVPATVVAEKMVAAALGDGPREEVFELDGIFSQ